MRYIAVLVLILQSQPGAQTRTKQTCRSSIGDLASFAAVYYQDTLLTDLEKFNLVILDPDNYDSSAIAVLKSHGCTPIAYMNVGEVETYRSYFDLIDTSMVLSPDLNWSDRYYVDICDPSWWKVIRDVRLPEIFSKGFCGVLVDFAGIVDEYPAMDSCAIMLLKKIRAESIGHLLIVDGVIPILVEAAKYSDAVMVEGLKGYYDFSAEEYAVRPDSIAGREADALVRIAREDRLTVLQLDYVAPDDSLSRSGIISWSRKRGFVPYVGTVELDSLFMETTTEKRGAQYRAK